MTTLKPIQYHMNYFDCANCKKNIDSCAFKYCPHCGTEIDWTD